MACESTVLHETYMTTMALDEWVSVPDNPVQRDTEMRAAKAKHLRRFEAAHGIVHMLESDKGRRCKLEGHTRAFYWSAHPEMAPDTVDVRVTVCPDEDFDAESVRLYSHYNSKEEAETASDKLFGAMRKQGITPSSTFVRKAAFSTALSMAHAFCNRGQRGESVYERVEFFADQIRSLDSFVGSRRKLVSPAVCCFFLAHKSHGNEVVQFFEQFLSDSGIKDGRRKDAVQFFTEAMQSYLDAGDAPGVKGCSWGVAEQAVAIGLACVERWVVAGHALMTRVKPVDVWKYIACDE
jgi:hypothetical protein